MMRPPRLLLPALLLLTLSGALACEAHWPYWTAYARHFIQHDGRVIEYSQAARSTSEAQAYALFHALVANDRTRFDTLLRWTRDNLARGDLRRHLPAWLWGRRKDGSWGVLDDNSASDADLWLAYTLIEAGRLWRAPRYAHLGEAVLANIERAEVRVLPGLGPMLLPGRRGFEPRDGTWPLNPSYLPLQLLARLAALHPDGPWRAIRANTVRLLDEAQRDGVVADWVGWRPGTGFVTLDGRAAVASYDAIRVYLWLGLLAGGDPLKRPLLARLRLPACRGGQGPPERMHLTSGRREGTGPVGFKAALLPYVQARGDRSCLRRLRNEVAAAWHGELLSEQPRYYDQNLALFSLGWLAGRYRFDAQGKLHTRWEHPCRPSQELSSSS